MQRRRSLPRHTFARIWPERAAARGQPVNRLLRAQLTVLEQMQADARAAA